MAAPLRRTARASWEIVRFPRKSGHLRLFLPVSRHGIRRCQAISDARHDPFLSVRAAVVHKDIPIRVMHRMTPRIAKRWGFSLWIEMGIVDQKSSSTIGRWPAAVRFCIATPYLWISCEGKFRRKFSPMSFPQLAPRLAIAGTRVSRKDDGAKLRGRAR